MKFSILITTKNRKKDLEITLPSIIKLLNNEVCCTIIDDGSTDGSYEFIKSKFPQINIIRNNSSKGYIYCRNKLLNECNSLYAISLDDDANFITLNPLKEIENFFLNNLECGVIAFRIYWNKNLPVSIETNEKPIRVKNFVGCGHVWRMESWKKIINYPEWYKFYGEEEFASFQLYKKGIQIWYLPSILVHHRVNFDQRKKNKEFLIRLKNSLKSGWFNFFIFLPINEAFYLFFYSIYSQLKNKVIKGDLIVFFSILFAFMEFIFNFNNIIKLRNPLNSHSYSNYLKIAEPKIYWKYEN